MGNQATSPGVDNTSFDNFKINVKEEIKKWNKLLRDLKTKDDKYNHGESLKSQIEQTIDILKKLDVSGISWPKKTKQKQQQQQPSSLSNDEVSQNVPADQPSPSSTVTGVELSSSKLENSMGESINEIGKQTDTPEDNADQSRKDTIGEASNVQLEMPDNMTDVSLNEDQGTVQSENKMPVQALSTAKDSKTPATDDGSDILNKEIDNKNKHIDDLLKDKRELRTQVKTMQDKIREIKEEREKLFLRLSKVAGEQVTVGNPDIADLNDKYRPSKLGEMYNELYDNEWSDAFDALVDAGYEDDEAIATLHLTLINVLDFCDGKARKLLEKTADAMNLLFEEYAQVATIDCSKTIAPHLTMSKKKLGGIAQAIKDASTMRVEDLKLQLQWKPKDKSKGNIKSKQQMKVTPVDVEGKMKVVRKEVSESMVPVVQKAYIDASWDKDCIDELIPYIKKCLFIGWMMVVQSPPLCLHKCSPGATDAFDTVRYRHYTQTGPILDFVVWPALLLHEDGPIVAKGVAQPKHKK